MNSKVVIAANTAWYLANFRLNLARVLQEAGYEVVAVAPSGEDATRLEAAGVRFVPVAMDNSGTNPLADSALLLRLLRVLLRERPAVYLGYTVKPNVYGGLACRTLGIPSVHNVAGLGTTFINDTWLTRLVRGLYRVGLGGAARVFFQNPDDMAHFVDQGLVAAARAERLPGSGVDTERFAPVPDASAGGPFRFLLLSRLLWDKGIGEYVEACRRLRAEGRAVECRLLGFLGVDNRTAIDRETVDGWEAEGVVRYLGSTDDVRPMLAGADCVVLPSYYREGVPRSLLEAASMARPVITTDTVGCREVVNDGVNGFLCRPRDADDLASSMRRMMDLPAEARAEMGQRGREKVVREFDERIVIRKYLEVIDSTKTRGQFFSLHLRVIALYWLYVSSFTN